MATWSIRRPKLHTSRLDLTHWLSGGHRFLLSFSLAHWCSEFMIASS